MKCWKRWTIVLAAALLLVSLAACGPSGPAASEQPGSGTSEPDKKPDTGENGGDTKKDPEENPGTGDTGEGGSGTEPGENPGKQDPDKEDESTPKTEEQKKIEKTVKALNEVRAKNKRGELTLNAEACARAQKMAQLQLDGATGKYGSDPMQSDEYKAEWNKITKDYVAGKKVVGIGGYGAYPDEEKFISWMTAAGEWKAPLVLSEKTTIVGVGVVKNTDEATAKEWPCMVVVMTY